MCYLCSAEPYELNHVSFQDIPCKCGGLLESPITMPVTVVDKEDDLLHIAITNGWLECYSCGAKSVKLEIRCLNETYMAWVNNNLTGSAKNKLLKLLKTKMVKRVETANYEQLVEVLYDCGIMIYKKDRMWVLHKGDRDDPIGLFALYCNKGFYFI